MLSEYVGAEEFGPPEPGMIENVTQYAMDMTGLQKNILYSIGAGVAAYFAYRMYNE